MANEIILILTQFGGGPGDPANNVVRFLLAAFFWGVLFLVSYRMWRATADRRHLYFSISAAVGAARELFMFTAEYGSFRGYLSFPAVFRYYPPLEHAVAILSIILMGYAFLRFYFSFERFSRLFLICNSLLTTVTYIVIAPLWLRFLDFTAHASLLDNRYIGAKFHDFPGDLIFRVEGAVVCFLILAAFLYAKTTSIRFPWLAFIAFFCFFTDDTLQIVNDLCNDRYAPVFGPLRHCLHSFAITQFLGAYWWEITQQLKTHVVALEQAQTNTQEALDKLSIVANGIPMLIAHVDTSQRYLYVNRAYADWVGQPENHIIGKTVQEIEPQEICNVSIGSIENVLRGIPCFLERKTIFRGEIRIHHVSFVPHCNEQGDVKAFFALVTDITDQRHLTEQLRHSQKMDAIGQLAGGVAHDFNNILTVITGYCQLIHKDLAENNPMRTNIERVLAAADRAANLTKSLLAFSRKQPMSFQVLDLNPTLWNIENFLNRIIGEDVQLAIQIANEPLMVSADSNQIMQVMMNLATNARDAMPMGGSLTLSLKRHDIDDAFVQTHGYGILGQYALLTARDTGNGMDEETRKRIFEPFFTTKEIGKGTGLGLAIVYGIVKQHNGFINVSSEQGKGTAFSIFIPLHAQSSVSEGNNAP